MKPWSAGGALVVVALLYSGLLGETSIVNVIGMYVLLLPPAGIGFALARAGRSCALKESGARHCDELSGQP